MFVIIQRPINVITDELIEVKSDINDNGECFFNTFLLDHVPVGYGLFTVFVSPYSTSIKRSLCEEPAKFTVDIEALQSIYNDPAKFIMEHVVVKDDRYSILKEEDCIDIDNPEMLCDDTMDNSSDKTSPSDIFSLFGFDDVIPMGFNVVTYTKPTGEVDTIAYSDDKKHVYTDEEKAMLDKAIGAGKYKLLDYKSARVYRKAKEKEFDGK